MLYFIKKNDTLQKISEKFGSSVHKVMTQNVICNPNILMPGIPLIIPENGENLPLAGGAPYYVVQPGDTLQCLASYFKTTVKNLIVTNQLYSPLQAGRELIVGIPNYHPNEFYEIWKKAGDSEISCSANSLHEVFYRGSFEWEGIGDVAIPYLSKLLKHSCVGIRTGAIESLGRIASPHAQKILTDYIRKANDPLNIDIAKIALQRIGIVQQTKNKRFHVTTNDWLILQEPKSDSPVINIPKGTVVVGLRWNIPSPFQEEGPKGGVAIFDYIKIVHTGQTGFLPRVGYNAIWLI